MTNKHLDNMVNALISGDNEAAKDHLGQYFVNTTARIINQQTEPQVQTDDATDDTQQ